jgi:asparagine synthase (glutamine-hydrolysing)
MAIYSPAMRERFARDQELMDFAASLPGSMKLRGLTTKFLLRRMSEELLPRPILKRSKQGFGLPIDRWMREDLAPLSRDVLLDQRARERGILDPAAVEDILARQQRGEPRGFQIWTMMILELWYRECLENGAPSA